VKKTCHAIVFPPQQGGIFSVPKLINLGRRCARSLRAIYRFHFNFTTGGRGRHRFCAIQGALISSIL
jgi:hypothetical protein